MKATFVELPPFERIRKDFMDDDAYRQLQQELMDNPEMGNVVETLAVCENCGNPTHAVAKANAVACG